MKPRFALSLFAALATMRADLVQDVRSSIAGKDFAAGERQIADYRKSRGVTPEMILALSWLGRGAQAAKNWDAAERYAVETRKLVDAELRKRKLDQEPNLPLALGASIEVMGHTLAGRGQRTEAVTLLQQELKTWWNTSIRTRTQKNLHLLSLEGKPLPALELKERVGSAKLPSASELKGKPMVLFFWAHWCADCKQQGPVLERLQNEYGPKGLFVLGPTQHYGYIAAGQDAPRAAETQYIGEIRDKFYGSLAMPVPVSEENFKRFGCSTTPTLVLVDRGGTVRMYHPGKMTYEELQPAVAKLVTGG
jgi:thiol-disulfide isomerase/thioredoxin